MARPSTFLLALLVVALGGQQAERHAPSPTVSDRLEREQQEDIKLMLQPKGLKDALQDAPRQELMQRFLDPPVEFRTAPLWVWNDQMDPGRIKEQLAQFKAQGMGGVFVHPRPGLITEYLGDEWFQMWRLALDESKRLGLLCNIYDENSYPAGFAGGHVPSLAPDTASQYVQAQFAEASPEAAQARRRAPYLAANTLAVFRVERDLNGRIRRATRVPRQEYSTLAGPIVYFSLRRASGNPWTGQFPYVDLTHPETARFFILTTYEAYKKHFGQEFGKTIRWAFCDEPLIATAGAYEQAELALPLSYNTLAEFRRRNGYDLLDHLPSLYWDVGDWSRVRFDYWQTLHDLWKENFFRHMFRWCDSNRIQFTGHYMEHEWPYPWISPDDASMYAYQHMPGIDMLVGAELRTKGVDPHMLFTIRQAASVANQLGRRAFSETYGVAGWDSTLEHYKRMGDWQIVNGINFIDQHLAFTTVRGARKRDHPQSFSDVSAWWPYYRLHADHTARLCYMMSQGHPQNRVLVLQPTTSGFLWARRGGETQELAELRRAHGELNQFLADHQVDFDLGDEYVIEWLGRVDGKRFVIGRAAYDLVIWPRGMINVRRQTVPLLEKYLASGGQILALDDPATYVDGRKDDSVRQLAQRFSKAWIRVQDLKGLLAEIGRRLAPRIQFDRELAAGVGHQMRLLSNGDRLHLLVNSGLESVSAVATVQGASIEEWDTVSGQIRPIRFEVLPGASDKVRFAVDLPPAGSRLYYVSMKATLAQPRPQERAQVIAALKAEDLKISPDSKNVLVLDYCDLKLASEEYKGINTWRANWIIWQAHGFERPAWDNAIQFRRRILDHPPFPIDSGFVATFRFLVSDAEAIRGAELALEAPELYKVYLNGRTVNFADAPRWLDPHIKSANVEDLVRVGENTVQIVGSPFDVRMELENVFVRGNFSLRPSDSGFVIERARPLKLGPWRAQGYPFYSDSVLYASEVQIPSGSRSMRVRLGNWAGSVAEVLLDGRRVGLIAWRPFQIECPVEAGRRQVSIRVVSTPRNLFGPFHNPSKPRMIAWPMAWSVFPDNQPPGKDYDLIDYGLLEPFTIEIMR